jgi:hypothetical protein
LRSAVSGTLAWRTTPRLPLLLLLPVLLLLLLPVLLLLLLRLLLLLLLPRSLGSADFVPSGKPSAWVRWLFRALRMLAFASLVVVVMVVVSTIPVFPVSTPGCFAREERDKGIKGQGIRRDKKE